MSKRKEIPVKNHSGIYKRFVFDEKSRKWNETGAYRATRWIIENGKPKKEQAVFNNLEDADLFHSRLMEKSKALGNAPRNTTVRPNDGMTFQTLLERWKPFHYLQVERSSQQTYEKRLPNLDYLKGRYVEEINTSVIDELVSKWVESYPKGGQRQTFEKELNLLKVVLNFYRKRVNPSYVIPILDEHYKAADIAKKPESPVASLSQEELVAFLNDLKNSKSPIFYSMALAQFSLGLRIGEVCGMTWDALDLEHRIARVEWTIVWDQITWEPTVKHGPKNGKIRVLVIPEILAEKLDRLRGKRDPNVQLIFHCHGKPMNRQTVAKAYNRALDRLEIKYVRGTHMLRKTSATLANKVTGDFYAVSRLMDHSSPNITLKYVAQTNAEKQKVAHALNGILMGNLEAQKTDLRSSKAKLHPSVGDIGGIKEERSPSVAETCDMSHIPQYPPGAVNRNLRLIKSIG